MRRGDGPHVAGPQHQIHVDATEKALRALAFDERQADAHRDAEERKANDARTRADKRASDKLKHQAVKEQQQPKGAAALGAFLA